MSLWFETRQKRHLFAVAGALGLSFSACTTPQEIGVGEPAVNGPLSVQVDGVSLERIDLEGPAGAMEYDRNVLLVRLAVSNVGASVLRWDPGFSSAGGTQAQNVLLYATPSWKEGLSPSNNIRSLSTGAWHYLGDPVREPVEVAPGETIQDVLVFSEPGSATTNLVLSIPPGLAGPDAKAPIFVNIPYAPGEVVQPKIAELNEVVEQHGLAFSVKSAEVAHQQVRAVDGTDSVSSSPLLRVRFHVENKSDAPMEYIPTRMGAGKDFPALTDQSGAVQNRATFAVGITPVGQLVERQTLAPGESLDDFILFERPSRNVESLTLAFPGSRLGSVGLFRVTFPYTWADPAVPEEFRPRQ